MSAYVKRGRPPKDPVAAFWAKVEGAGGCQIWQAARDKNTGQGKFQWRGTVTSAQRVAYEIVHGHPPAGVMVNQCGNSSCVDPAHWRIGPKPTPDPVDWAARRRAKFERNVRQALRVPDLGPCWEWQGYVDPAGYGRISMGRGRGTYTHRYAYLEFVGPIPDGTEIDHLCRNQCCCNPAHLEAVTHRENCARSPLNPFFNAEARERARASRLLNTHCRRGHELSGDNLRVEPDGHRRCRACQRLNYLDSLARRKHRPAA